MIKTPFKLKYKNLEGVVDELANASKMHKKQSEVIEDHIADMEGESPAKDKDPKSGLVDLTGKPTEHDDDKVDLTKKSGLGPRENNEKFDHEKYSDLEKYDDDK